MNGTGKEKRTDVMGVGFDSITLDEAANKAFEIMKTKGKAYLVTPNPEIVMLCREDFALWEAVNGADMVLPDGIGIVYAAKILGTPLAQKVPGIDFASAVMERMASEGLSVFLFGAKPGVAELAAKNLKARFPGLAIAGTNDGYFSDDVPIIDKINSARPDFLMVCLGAPKQELWISRNILRLEVPLIAGLGGSLDVFAGTVKRAPAVWQRMGLEWLYRLVKEPRRIKRMAKLPLFMIHVILTRIRGKKDAR
jgi:N-acetylglucosaminyldiphosphoundecaprenol N-acetyl-beta-D-mannosaminyltransferase